jgi:YfiH family protein
VTFVRHDGALSEVPLAGRIDPAARARLRVCEWAGLEVIEARLPGPFRVMFTTRQGGVSAGPYASLNLSYRVDDDPKLVADNRAWVAAAVDSRGRDIASQQPLRLISPTQVHGVRVVGAAEYAAAGKGDGCDSIEDPCDGLVIHPLLDQGLAALLLFADCVPLVLVGEVDMAVVHGGWRGILDGIVRQAGRAMTGPPGLAIIGPSLGPCCFTVGREVAGAFADRFGTHVVVEEERVDLWAAASVALEELGVRRGQIVNPRLCTACNRDLFYSYRAEGPTTGRHGCVAWTAAA